MERKRETGDGIRKVAKAYYEQATPNERRDAEDYFHRFRPNRDGKISLVRFRNGYNSEVPADKMFRALDSDNDGVVDFLDILVLFYAEERDTIRLIPCDGINCGELLFGSYFSCITCLREFPRTYDLCCDCYGGGNFQHRHPKTDFLHDQGLLTVFMGQRLTMIRNNINSFRSLANYSLHHQQGLLKAQPNTRSKGEMEELRKIAMLHYHATSPKVKHRAKDFYKSLDHDEDGRVTERDFLWFMWELGFHELRSPGMFEKLDMDGDGVLNFKEAMTLYYVIKSGRPHCSWCNKFISGVFFSCIQCFRDRTSFVLCCTCYDCTDCLHTHEEGTHFLDNYTLLQTMKTSSPLASHHHHHQQWAEPSSSRAIVPASGKTKTDVAYKALELAIAVSNTIGNMAVNAGNLGISKCAIM